MNSDNNRKGTMTITTSDFTAKGNAVAFTSDSQTITIRKKDIPFITEWIVEVGTSLTEQRTRTFASKTDAAKYATSIADAEKTEELAWW